MVQRNELRITVSSCLSWSAKVVRPKTGLITHSNNALPCCGATLVPPEVPHAALHREFLLRLDDIPRALQVHLDLVERIIGHTEDRDDCIVPLDRAQDGS